MGIRTLFIAVTFPFLLHIATRLPGKVNVLGYGRVGGGEDRRRRC
jgi:hypothetical protein